MGVEGRSIADAMRYVGDRSPITLEDRATDALVGCVGLVHPDQQPEAEVKYALARAHWGTGLATEAVRHVLAWAARFGVSEVIATVAPENAASPCAPPTVGRDTRPWRSEPAAATLCRGGERMRFAAWTALIIGAMMLAQWTFFIGAGQVPEFVTQPYAIAFHLVAEFATAGALIVSGAFLLRGRRGAVGPASVAFGMLVYTAINSSGYVAQLGQWPLVGMFAVVLAVSLAAVARLLKPQAET